jgi:hypothetical protein
MNPICLALWILAFSLTFLKAQTNGIDQTLNLITPPTGGKFIQWQAKAGRSYFLQVSDPSDHLNKWNWSTVIETGTNQSVSYEVDGTAEKGFFRLHYTDQTATNLEAADFDTDGLTNLQEITPVIRPGSIAARTIGGSSPPPNSTQTNPLDGDTDHDGLGDKFERDHNLDPTDNGSINPNNGPSGDPDGDGNTNLNQQATENLPTQDLSTNLVYRGALYKEQRFQHGAYAQTTLYSKSLVDHYRSAMLSNYVMKAPDITGTATINSDTAYIEPTHPTDPQEAFAAPGVFKSFFKNKFPIPPLLTTDNLSTWNLANSPLNYGTTFRDILPAFFFIVANEATYEFAIRASTPTNSARTEKRTLLQILKTTPSTPNVVNPAATYTTITPATVEMTFTIPAGKTASASQRLNTPVAQITGVEDLYKDLILLPVDLDLIHPATGELADDREDGTSSSPDGGYVSIKRTVGSDAIGGEDVAPVTKLSIKGIYGISPVPKVRLKFNGGDRYKLYKDVSRTQEVVSEQTEFNGNQETTLYFQGLKKSLSRGGEKVTMQVKLTNNWVDGDSVDCTIVQSEFLIQIKAFIPYEWTEGESTWVTNLINPMSGKVAHGDLRNVPGQFKNAFSNKDLFYSVAPFRLCHEVILTPYVDLHYFYQDLEAERKFTSALTSDHYSKASSVNASELVLRNGYLPLAPPSIATGPPVVFPATYSPELSLYNILRANKCALNLTASGKDGAMGIFTAASPAIDWDVRLEVDSSLNPLLPSIRVKGKHDLYPAYEIIAIQADGTFKDTHRHMPNRDVYPGPISLSGAPSITFDSTVTISN